MALVNFYAASRAATGVQSAIIYGSTLGEIIDSTIIQFPELEKIILRCSYLVNEIATVDLSHSITSKDSIDVLPQFAGGA